MRHFAQQKAGDGPIGDFHIDAAADHPVSAAYRVAHQGSGEALRMSHSCVEIRQFITLHTVGDVVRGTDTEDIARHVS